MRRIFFLLLPLMFFISCGATNNISDKNISSELSTSPVRIEEFYDIDLNGIKQRILIQSNNARKNPVLLYLHGGPGSSSLIYSYLYNKKLKDHFIFVNWDQRGTAFSYHEGMPSNISEDIIRSDALELIKYLMNKFNKKKIYLAGHSFGSVLGLQLVANNPELFYAYIGVGQVIDYNYYKSVIITYNWLHNKLTEAGDINGLRRIEKDKFPYIDLVTKYGGHHRLSIDLDMLKKNSPYYFDGYFQLAEKSKTFTLDCMEKTHNFKKKFNKPLTKIDVPLFFFEGINDHVIASAPSLVVEYCKIVKAPKTEIIWFNNSAHMPNIEEPEKFQDELIKISQSIN